jgi:hypothetical protein
MKTKIFFTAVVLAIAALAIRILVPSQASAGEVSSSRYEALAAISRGNLTIFPVVSSASHDTREFLTLDEGMRSGEVLITEAGSEPPLIRRRPQYPPPQPGSAQVNTLMLVNNSKRPLLLLAGEIVTGGRQDRIVGKDAIIAPESDADLDVFCVEPGRWTGVSEKFGAAGVAGGVSMVQPSVRTEAMANKNQQGVWNEVNKAKQSMSETVEVTAGAPMVATEEAQIAGTTSYARVMQNHTVTKQIDRIAEPIEHSYESSMRELRARNAVGVVVAINGQIEWADIFASTDLLQKYWPKLVRSYAAEAVERSGRSGGLSAKDAQRFLDDLSGTHEVVESEPGVYRHTEISGDGYKIFELTSLLPETGFEVHIAKMTE